MLTIQANQQSHRLLKNNQQESSSSDEESDENGQRDTQFAGLKHHLVGSLSGDIKISNGGDDENDEFVKEEMRKFNEQFMEQKANEKQEIHALVEQIQHNYLLHQQKFDIDRIQDQIKQEAEKRFEELQLQHTLNQKEQEQMMQAVQVQAELEEDEEVERQLMEA